MISLPPDRLAPEVDQTAQAEIAFVTQRISTLAEALERDAATQRAASPLKAHLKTRAARLRKIAALLAVL